MFENPLFWILVLPGLLLGVYAQSRIKLNIAKYSQVRTKDGITGAQVARLLLDSQGLRNVAIESSPGMLSDHYDPRSKTLRLSQAIYFAPSIAAAGIAAHEAGHALQDAVGYFPLKARTSIVPLVQLASLAVYRGHITTVSDHCLGRHYSLWVVFAVCFDHLAGSPWRNAAARYPDCEADSPSTNPITGTARCCARAASGHATALPSSVTNARRLMPTMGAG